MMTSVVDNGSSMDMPQWKRDLIMRRRAQQAATVSKQLSSACDSNSELSNLSKSCGCKSPEPSRTGTTALVSLGCHPPPFGHQPSVASTSGGTRAASSRCACCRNGSPSSSSSTATSCVSSSVVKSACSKCCVPAQHPRGLLPSCQPVDNSTVAVRSSIDATCCEDCDMVRLHTDSDSSEELQYGPGIVSKLKTRYLSLTLRQGNVKRRPSILRKASSLENLLDEEHVVHLNGTPQPEDPTPVQRLYDKRTNGTNGNAENVPSSNRYLRNSAPKGRMQRARSVEAISRVWSPKTEPATDPPPRINKPKRIPPLITEREKPPADVVKQTMKIFEARPESRTRPPQYTGDVAAKVATYKTIIKQTTANNKPPIKQKPVLHDENFKNITMRNKPNMKLNLQNGDSNNSSPLTSPLGNGTNNSTKSLPSPIPDVSMVQEEPDDKKISNLSETPDLILHSSPIHVQKHHGRDNKASEELIQAEINNALKSSPRDIKSPTPTREVRSPTTPIRDIKSPPIPPRDVISPLLSNKELMSPSRDIKSPTFPKSPTTPTREVKSPPIMSREVKSPPIMTRDVKTPPLSPSSPLPSKIEPLTLDITNSTYNHRSPIVNNRDPVLVLSPREIEKNAINSANNINTLGQKVPTHVINSKDIPDDNPSVAKQQPPALPSMPPKTKARKAKQSTQEQNSIVFIFTDRKDVPDYIGNDGCVRTQSVAMPKPGEGGITLLPGTTIHDAFDEELRSLEGPPSPCDVNFINDNVLIDGKSSLSKKNKKSKLRIQFVEAVPQVFEYPSEASMLVDDSFLNQPIGGKTVPLLSGSTLANYTPKAASSDFQLGVTKSVAPPISTEMQGKEEEEVIEHEEPMLFSSGTNADILF